METLNIKEQYEKRLDTLWANAESTIDTLFANAKFKVNEQYIKGLKEIIGRKYAASESVTKGSVFFVGINPSYKANQPDKHFFKFDTCGDQHFKRHIEIKDRIKEKLPDLEYSYLDFIFVRDNDQNTVLKMLNDSNLTAFIEGHIEIFKEIVEKAAPKVISVNNNAIKKFLLNRPDIINCTQRHPDSKYEKDSKIEAHIITEPHALKGTPVFFTAMLAGEWGYKNFPLESLCNLADYIKDAAK